MGRVVDVDTHWIFPWEFEFAKGPLAQYAGELPEMLEAVAFFMTGDMLASLDPADRPRGEQLWPPRETDHETQGKVPAHFDTFKGEVDTNKRLEWMDAIGIDFAFVNPGGFASLGGYFFPEARRRHQFLESCNDVLAEPLQGHQDRLGMVTAVDMSDLDWSIRELKRTRALGSRAATVRAEPVNGKSLGHSHFDRFWATLTDLGMVINLHVGAVPGHFGDWGKIDWNFTSERDRGAFIRMANTQRHQNAEMFINSLLYGGVFERFPTLTLVMAELWAGWFPNFVRHTEVYSAKEGPWGRWAYPLSAGDYLRRQVRLTPLPGLGDWDALDLIKRYPEMIVFSSDLPHTEGNADPINLYRPGFDQLPAQVREQFLGENMANVFDRMGDPVVSAPVPGRLIHAA